jgi:DnaJ family protein C protein 28
MSFLQRGVEEIIQKAIREGAFDDLKGKGKPLNLNENPFVDKEWQLAYRLLEQQGFALPWMEKRNEIESALKAARESLSRTWDWRASALEAGEPSTGVDAEWRRAKERFREAVARLNKLIDGYNLEVPSDIFFREKIKVEVEMASLKDNQDG